LAQAKDSPSCGTCHIGAINKEVCESIHSSEKPQGLATYYDGR
jgi:hypothetical protein